MPIQFLNTPALTDVSRLRFDAKKRVKADNIPLSTALDAIAFEATGADTWSQMMSDHVVTLDDNNALSFAVTSPSNETWNLRSQLAISLDDLRDALMSTRTLAYNAKAIGSKRRTRIEMTLGLRDMTFGHGSHTFTLSEASAETVRSSLLNSSMRLRAAGAVSAIKHILNADASLWNDISYAKYTAVVIDPESGSIFETTHDGTFSKLTELAGLTRGQNLTVTVLNEQGLLAIHLPEDLVVMDGISIVEGQGIRGQVVLISRDPATGKDQDLPENMPELDWSAVKLPHANRRMGVLGGRGSPLSDPNNLWRRGASMSTAPKDYPSADGEKGPIQLTASTDLSRVTRPVVYRGRRGEDCLEVSYENGSCKLHIGKLDGDTVTEISTAPCENLQVRRAPLMVTLMEEEDAGLASWARRGISADGVTILEPITTADIMMFKARRDAQQTQVKAQKKELAGLKRFCVGGKKGDWVLCDRPISFLTDLGVEVDMDVAPKNTPAGWTWAALVMEDHVRAAILLPDNEMFSDIDDWEGKGRIYVSSSLDDAWTYAGSLADVIVGRLPEEHQKIGYDIVQQIVRQTDDLPQYDVREHLGIDAEGKPIGFDIDPGLWDDEQFNQGM